MEAADGKYHEQLDTTQVKERPKMSGHERDVHPEMRNIKVLKKQSSFSSIQDDAEFVATPIVPAARAQTFPTNPTFPNQLAFDRSPTALDFQFPALPQRSRGNSNARPQTSFGALPTIPQGERQTAFGRPRGGSNASNSSIDTIRLAGYHRPRRDQDELSILREQEILAQEIRIATSAGLSRSRSVKSTRSTRSVDSIRAIGSLGFGSLRVHEIAPKLIPDMETHNALLTGDVIIVRDVPIGTIIGYDARSIVVAQKNVFEGIKEVPPGAHFIWGGSSAGSLRTGFWLISSVKGSTEHGQRIVKRWDAHHEMLVDEPSAAEVYNQKLSISEIVDKLHPYGATPAGPSGGSEILAKYPNIWQDLTSSIKGNMLSKITGTDVWNGWHVSSTHDYKVDRGEKPTTAYGKDEVLTFVFPKDLRTFSRHVTGRQRTEQAMDTTAHILAVISDKCTYQDSDEIVGEIQFCYITGMILGNVACMEHYAHVVKMVFKAIQLPMADPIFFLKFIKAVQAQFTYDNVGIDGSIFDHDSNFEKDLRLILISFKSRFNELIMKQKVLDDDQKAVCKTFDEFENWLWKFRNGWDLRGDYVRSGKIQLEDGEIVDMETTDFEAEDERGPLLGRGSKLHTRKKSKSTAVWF